MTGDALKRFRELLGEAKNVVFFTGAGISTESGIPDFRSPKGIWAQMGPIYYDDFLRSEEARRETWRRVFDDSYGVRDAKPNDGHRAVAGLIASGKASCVITQNIDNLHQASGIEDTKIIELHGNTTYAKCVACGTRHELDVIKQSFLGRGEIPICRDCGGWVKCATISFGQAMPETEMARAQEAALACDLMVVLGSSLVVYPAASFPMLAKRNGAGLVIINRDETEQDAYADVVLHESIGEVMKAVTRIS